MGKLTLSPETVRMLTVPELGGAQGGIQTISDCWSFDEHTKRVYSETQCVAHSRTNCLAC
jgi:hypothetical protein